MWQTLLESIFIIGAISAGLVWHAVVIGRREDREVEVLDRAAKFGARKATGTGRFEAPDPDAHLGRTGTE
jgi:predicted NAD/FAD-dependent oxidoreductase